jgi:hypothetical protein
MVVFLCSLTFKDHRYFFMIFELLKALFGPFQISTSFCFVLGNQLRRGQWV